MTTRTVSDPQVQRIIRSMQEQGVGVTRTKKGLLFRLPDGSSTAMHFTNSDVRAEANLIARLRRSGVRHPDDQKNVAELPKNITEAKVATRTKDKVLKAVADLGYPDSVKVLTITELANIDHVTCSRGLYALGFRPIVGKRNSRDWQTPGELLDLRPREEEPVFEPGELIGNGEREPYQNPGHTIAESADPEWLATVTGARLFQQEVNEHGMGKPEEPKVELSAGREFIDTHESWTVATAPACVEEYLDTLRGAGLTVEIRVWRA